MNETYWHDRCARAEAEVDALLQVLMRVAGILRGTEDEDQGAAYDNALRVLDAAIAIQPTTTKE